jgi:DNA polymerase-3 subunit epsilon
MGGPRAVWRGRACDPMPSYLAFDVETTGMERDHDRIVSLACRQLDDKLDLVSQHEWMFNPGIRIGEDAVAVHGITNAMVADRPAFKAQAARIQRLFQDRVLIAHNLDFDVAMVDAELRRNGQPGLRVNPPGIDTLAIERAVVGHNLAATYERRTGRKMENWHSASADVEAAVEILKAQMAAHADVLPDLESASMHRVASRVDPKHAVALESQGYFVARLGDGLVRFGYGKYKGQLVDRSATEQLDWVINKATRMSPQVIALARHFMDRLVAEPQIRVDPFAYLPEWGRPERPQQGLSAESPVGEATA